MHRDTTQPDDPDADRGPDLDATWNAPLTAPPPPPPPARPGGGAERPGPGAPAAGTPGDEPTGIAGSGNTAAYDPSFARHGTIGLPDDSKDSDGVTPAPGGIGPEEAGDWDRLPPPVFLPNAVVFGKYRLVKLIGEGGMGQVWLVDNLELDCKSALKLIRPEIAKNEKAWRRFKREAQVMAKLEHPNAIIVRDFKRVQSVAYIEMEYVRGESLDKLLDANDGRPMPLDWIAPVVDQLCSVLQEAHNHVDENTGKPRPIIHRDLKPSNLMLLSKGDGKTLKVLDFGIAKMAESDDDREAHLTGEAEFIGTAGYSSPEQIRGEPIDGRSDLYSLGVMLYQFLTGVLPFQGGARRSLVAHLTETPRPLREANPDAVAPPELEWLVLQCMEKSPERRPRSARELAERFRTAAGDAGANPAAGVRVKTPPRPFPVVPVASAAVLAVALIAAGFVASKWMKTGTGELTATRKPLDPGPGGGPSAPPPPPPSAAASTTAPVRAERPLPKGYKAGTPLQLVAGRPRVLVREADGAKFLRAESGVYLPIGYKAEDPDQLIDGWPKVLVRNTDQARFVRISGDPFERGDFEADKDSEPAADRLGNPCVRHWVELSGFYMQETEVTNLQVEAFLKEHPGEIPEEALREWRRYVDLLTAEVKGAARRYPAVLLDHATASKFAAGVSGLLPTESQWEFAARSAGLPILYATKHRLAPGALPKANLRGVNAENELYPMPVMSFKDGKDETAQGVYDLTGNVREMCRDAYRPYAEVLAGSREREGALHDPCAEAPPGPEGKAARRVVRGGSFQRIPEEAVNYQRDAEDGLKRLNDLGFRLVIECPPRPDPDR